MLYLLSQYCIELHAVHLFSNLALLIINLLVDISFIPMELTVHERRMEHNDCPWKSLMDIRKVRCIYLSVELWNAYYFQLLYQVNKPLNFADVTGVLRLLISRTIILYFLRSLCKWYFTPTICFNPFLKWTILKKSPCLQFHSW